MCPNFLEPAFITCKYRQTKKFVSESTDTNRRVRSGGLEPPRRETLDPKSSAATNYATSANAVQSYNYFFNPATYLVIFLKFLLFSKGHDADYADSDYRTAKEGSKQEALEA